jgi:hypothetical protein
MANEREPGDPLPADFEPEGFVVKHRVSDGEDWASVAAQYDVNVKDRMAGPKTRHTCIMSIKNIDTC